MNAFWLENAFDIELIKTFLDAYVLFCSLKNLYFVESDSLMCVCECVCERERERERDRESV